jgi:TolB-like protein/DNA-binding winged helix-turn-helix (wHTH) protein
MDMRLSPRWSRAWRLPRRSRIASAPRDFPQAPLRVGDAAIDLAEGRVTAPDGTVTELRRQSADVLRLLAARAGRTVAKSEILDAVWGDIAVTEDSLVQCVADIRRALGGARDRLHTAHRSGYRLDTDAAPPRARAPLRRGAVAALALAALALVPLGIWKLRDRPAADFQGPVVAVLPFENLAGGERWDRLARGVTEEVIADLATNPWLFVLADATTRPHAGETPQAVGTALGAAHVVTGTIQAEAGRARVSATLADAGSGRQVWTKQWEGPAGDLLAIQAAASEALVGELAGRYSGALARAGLLRAHGAGTTNLDAYDLFLLAVERKQKHGFALPDLDVAEDYLTRATELDAGFARAWAVLAMIQGMRSASATTDAEWDGLEARRLAYLSKAVEADPDDPATLIEVAKQAARDGDHGAASLALRRAVALAPSDADILAGAAWIGPETSPLATEALTWAERALALNPEGPAWYRTALGIAAFAVGDDARAAEALASDPSDFPDRLLYLAAAEAMLGQSDRAQAAGDRLRKLVPGFDLAFYMDGWPWDPGLWQRLHEGAVRAGLGGTTVADR